MLGTNLLLTAWELWNQNPRFFNTISEATYKPTVYHISFNTFGIMNIYNGLLMQTYAWEYFFLNSKFQVNKPRKSSFSVKYIWTEIRSRIFSNIKQNI